METKHSGKRICIWIVLIAAICAIAVSGYHLWQIQQMYAEGDRIYEEIANDVWQETLIGVVAGEATAEVKAPAINFEALKAMNKDTVAWLYSPGTAINYPVMKADDYSWYLRHLPDGTYNGNGSLFLDYNCAPDFGDRLSIIYGHRMKSGKMFGSLEGYKEQEYYDEHPYMYLSTEQGNYRIDLLYGCVIGAKQWRDRAFMFEENLNGLLGYAAYHTTFDSDVTYAEEDRFIALSTCSYEFDDARYVVVGVMKPEDTK